MAFTTPGNRDISPGGRIVVHKHSPRGSVPQLNPHTKWSRAFTTRVGVVVAKILTREIKDWCFTGVSKVRGRIWT